MIFFELLSSAFSCLLYGFLTTFCIMAIIYVVLRQLSRGIVQSIGFYISGCVLTIVFLVQFTLMFGAFKAKEYVDTVETEVSQLAEGICGAVSSEETKEIIDELRSENYMFDLFMNNISFQVEDVTELPHVIAQTYRDKLNSFLWERFWWILGSMVVAIIIMILTRERSSSFDFDGMNGDSLDTNTGDLIEDSLCDTDIYSLVSR